MPPVSPASAQATRAGYRDNANIRDQATFIAGLFDIAA
jgi:hypothetical protein